MGDDVAGAAYVFRFNGSSWEEAEKLEASDPARSVGFGWFVAHLEGIAIVGAPGTLTEFGSAYLFALDGSDCNSNGQIDLCDIATGVSVDGDSNFVPDDCEAFTRGDADGNGIFISLNSPGISVLERVGSQFFVFFRGRC